MRASAGALVAAILLVATLFPGEEAAAQRRRGGGGGLFAAPVEVGLRGGRDFENHAWSLGGQIRVPVGRRLELRPSGDVFFPRDGKTGWQLNADAALRFGRGGFYAGGGLAFLDLAESGGGERGSNLFFGLSDLTRRLKPFFEFRWTFYNDTSPFRLALGFSRAITGSRR